MTGVIFFMGILSVRSEKTFAKKHMNIAAGLSGQKFETSKVCIHT